VVTTHARGGRERSSSKKEEGLAENFSRQTMDGIGVVRASERAKEGAFSFCSNTLEVSHVMGTRNEFSPERKGKGDDSLKWNTHPTRCISARSMASAFSMTANI